MTKFAAEWWVFAVGTSLEALDYLRPIIDEGGKDLGLFFNEEPRPCVKDTKQSPTEDLTAVLPHGDIGAR